MAADIFGRWRGDEYGLRKIKTLNDNDAVVQIYDQTKAREIG